ncbi:hypothetical protein P9209_07825 [Prescottella defluvii]|nr:hypothetical protein P9209_07825 [Prescottella defluvii]
MTRHTAGTTLHLQGVPVAVIASWIGHCGGKFACGSENGVAHSVEVRVA